MERRDPAGLTRAEGRRFAFTLAVAFGVLAGLLWWRERETLSAVSAGLGSALLLLGVLVPDRLGPIHRAWMGLAALLSRVTTPIFMALVYYLVLTPVGLARRVLGSDPLQARDEGGSYWVSRTDGGSRSDMHRQF